MAFWHAHEKLATASHQDSADKQSETHSEFLKAQDRLYHAAERVASANKNGGEEAQACDKDRMDPSFLEDISELVKAMQISRAAEEAQQEVSKACLRLSVCEYRLFSVKQFLLANV